MRVHFGYWTNPDWGYACVGLVLALVATTMVMSVQDRIKEYAVLQTIGSATIASTSIGLDRKHASLHYRGVGGTLIALLALALGGFAIVAEGATIAFRPSANLLVSGAVVSVLVGLLSGIAPAIQAATVPIVRAVNQP